MFGIFNNLIYALGWFSFLAILAGAAFVLYCFFDNRRISRGSRVAQLARHVEQRQERQTEPLPAWFEIDALDLLGKEG